MVGEQPDAGTIRAAKTSRVNFLAFSKFMQLSPGGFKRLFAKQRFPVLDLCYHITMRVLKTPGFEIARRAYEKFAY
jgi:hypothetical protein